MDPNIWKTRAVIVHRDENNGYGLTVSGDNPVQVQTIKRDGAADRAGIREGDIIVKVNGTLVEHMNHTEVVNLIRAAGPYVTLTVKPSDLISMPGVGLIGGNGGRPHHIPTNDRVTAPLPVNQEIQQQLQGNKLRTLQAMRDKAQADVEKLWKKYEMTQNPRDMSDFERAQQGLKRIESQMKSFRQSTPNLQLHAPAPFNSYPQLHQPVPFQPYPQHGNPGGSPVLGPPPGRHRNPMSQQSTVIPPYENIRWSEDEPPPLPPRSYPHPAMINQSAVDNSSPFSPPPGYSPHDPLAQMVNLCNTSVSPGPHLLQQTHHRAKSSPDPVAMQKALSCAEGSRRSDSVSDLSKSNSLNSKSRSSSAWDSVDSTATHLNSPPGSPPPPYGHGRHSDNDSSGFDDSHTPSGSVNISSLEIFSPKSTLGALNNRPSSNPAVDIISMEEDDGLLSGDVVLPSLSGKQGPYSSLSKLLEHNAHLAVFINYVIDNRLDPSSLLFYLITGLNLEEGSIKEMKRWCYEIHSTFTAPGAPLLIPNVAENIAAEIDDGLMHESDKEEMMRRVFRKARNKAKEEINKQLEEFCNKRIAGLGSMFGPPDNQLEESINDPVKQLKIVETYLLPRLDQFHDDYEKNQDDKTMAIVNAIATVLNKQFGVRTQQSENSVINRCPSFVSKEKSIKSKLISKHKKITMNGHHLTPQFYYSYTECNICSKLLWGVGPQGYQCVDCHVNIHIRGCTNHIQDNCLGTGQRKEKTNDKFWKLKERIRPEQRRRINAKKNSTEDSNSWLSSGDLDPGDRPLAGSGSSTSNLKGDRRPDTLSEERLENDGLVCENEEMDRVRHEPKRTTNAVGRSESCKEPQRKQPRERRKHSDPNLTSKSSDVDLDNQRHLSDANNSGSSSNSSLSARSLDSPNTSSLELVNHYRGRDSETPENPGRHSEIISDSSFGRIPPGWEGDSDIEIEADLPDWTKDVPEETLSRLDPLEKKRQEVLNELFYTERLYVRKLKVMDRLFSRPMKNQQLFSQLIDLLFPNMEEMLDIHDQFNVSLKRIKADNTLVGDIGPVLLELFDGERGEQFRLAAARFCAGQQIGLEQLREKRKRDMKFHAFLTEAESNPVCRRLGIKDMIPAVMQRLTKYPLMFERLCNCTAADSTEYKNYKRAWELSKEILCSVNTAKKEAEDEERLNEIQRRLDKSYFEKGVERTDHSYNDLRNFDFTRHKLMYDGHLIWRLQKPRGDKLKSEHQEVLLVLLEDMIVLLLKVDDRYVLKMHNVGTGKAERMPAKPIIKLNTLHATRVAADKRAFYLLSKSSPTPFMFELVCSTAEERTLWLQHISRAADDYKSRQESRRSEVHPIGSIPPSVSESEDKSKETGEVTESAGSDQTTDPVTQQEPSATTSNKDSSPIPEGNQGTTNDGSGGGAGDTSPQSPEKNDAGDGAKGGQAPTPADRRKQGEFLRVTESSPLIDPSEVVVETTEVHFAKIICSPYEELKRCDSKIHMAFDEKLKIISKLCHIPPEGVAERVGEELGDASSPNSAPKSVPKDAKELVAACIHQVDQLGRLVASQKMTSENIQHQKEQLGIHKVLNSLLTQLLSEVHRKDEDLELRRQELYRVREQNHGYQERLQAKSKVEQASLVSPVRSPTQSRPNSFNSLSSTSDHHDFAHDDETEVSKRQLSGPVASSSSNSTSDPPPTVTTTASMNPDAGSSCTTTSACELVEPSSSQEEVIKRTQSVGQGGQERNSTSESAPEEFADALEDMVTTDWDSGIETNRESTETEVVAPTNEITSNSTSSCQQQMDSVGKEQASEAASSSQVPISGSELKSSSIYENVPENGAVNEIGTELVVTPTPVQDTMTNGHAVSSSSSTTGGDNNNTSVDAITTGKCNSITASSTLVEGETQQS